MTKKIVIGTRGSALALKQTEMVIAALGCECEVKVIKTSGDKDKTTPLAQMGGKEVFTKEIDEAMLRGEIDIAVHSCKDIAGDYDARISVAACLPREDVRDSLIGANSIAELPQNAKLGTSSPRRKAQLLALRPDLQISDIRGNVGTRIKKVQDGEYDATILAVAGLKRLGLNEHITPVPTKEMLPAAGQAAIAITCLQGNEELVAKINHQETFITVQAERAAIKEFGGDCHSTIAVNGELANEEITLRGFVDGKTFEMASDINEPEKLGILMGKKLKEHA